MIQYPLVVLLTHRRGAAAVLIKNEQDLNPIFMRVLGQTAENLLSLYTALLTQSNLQTQSIQTIAVGVGPGSFTGLRLGCAFANGIKLGQNCNLVPIKTEFPDYFLSQENNTNSFDKNDFLAQLGTQNTDDISSGFVTFYDLSDALIKLKNNPTTVQVLEPIYGREPGPVLKLKGLI